MREEKKVIKKDSFPSILTIFKASIVISLGLFLSFFLFLILIALLFIIGFFFVFFLT